MDYLLHIAILIGMYLILSVSLNLVAGYTGLLSIAHAALFGIGAYTAALLSLKLNMPFLLSALLAMCSSTVLGILLALPSLRVRDEYFVMASLAFQVVIFRVLNNCVSVTGGPMGLPGIPTPDILGWEVSSRPSFLLLAAAASALALFVSWRIVSSPLGRVLKTIREDEALAATAGKNVAAAKVVVFAVAACMAGLAGVLFAYYISYIDPTSFSLMESIFILSIVIIGGAGSLWGSVVGVCVLVTLPELLRFLGMPSPVAANVRQIIYGAALIAMMLWRPQGLLGEYSFHRSAPEL